MNLKQKKVIDPEVHKLRDELNFYKMKDQQSQMALVCNFISCHLNYLDDFISLLFNKGKTVNLLQNSSNRQVDQNEWMGMFMSQGQTIMNQMQNVASNMNMYGGHQIGQPRIYVYANQVQPVQMQHEFRDTDSPDSVMSQACNLM